MERSITYREWDDKSAAIAGWLHLLGLQDGARVAIMLPNILHLIAAVLPADFTLTCINPLYTPRELKNQLNDSSAETIIILENFAHSLEKVLADTIIKHIKKMVPDYSLPTAIKYIRALEVGSARTYTPF